MLVISPCNNFCVGALSEQLLIWQLSTGKLVASLRRHYQNVSDVKFTADSSRFISAGAEGLVLLWSLDTVLHTKVSDSSVISYPDCHHLLSSFIFQESEPDSIWSDHSLPVTGLHVTKSLIQPLVFSVSLDQTCKIRDLNTGKTLFNIQFNEVYQWFDFTRFLSNHNAPSFSSLCVRLWSTTLKKVATSVRTRERSTE